MKWANILANIPSRTVNGACWLAEDGAVVVRYAYAYGTHDAQLKIAGIKFRYYAHGPKCVTDWKLTPEEAMQDYENGIWAQTKDNNNNNNNQNNQKEKSRNARDV